MLHAVGLGRRHLGQTGENPSVGCVIMKQGRVVGRAVTATGGRPHAETQALAMAGAEAAGADVYVTLEPCAHQGKTPPCTEALIAAKVARVFYAVRDPDPRVSGKGIAQLAAAGIETLHLPTPEAEELHAGFVLRHTQQRPFITLKLGTSLDGRIALANGESKWITNNKAREFAHALRATHDAILAGTDTILHDNPTLTCRLPGLEAHSPVRVVLDRTGKIPRNHKVFQGHGRCLLFTTKGAYTGQAPENTELIYTEPMQNGMLPVKGVCQILSERGINRLLIEGGSKLASSFLGERFVDALVWLQSPKILGGDGLPAVGPLALNTLEEAYGFRVRYSADLEGDRLLTLHRAP